MMRCAMIDDCACTMSKRTCRSARQVSPPRPGPMQWLPRRLLCCSTCPRSQATYSPREFLVSAPWCREDLTHVGQGHSVMISQRTRKCGRNSPRKNKCHAVSSLSHAVSCTVLWRTFENGSYSRISALIFPTSQQLNGSLQHAR